VLAAVDLHVSGCDAPDIVAIIDIADTADIRRRAAVMQRGISILTSVLVTLAGLGLGHAAPVASPRVVEAKDAPASRGQPPAFLANPPQPETQVLLSDLTAIHLSPTGPAIPALVDRRSLTAIELTDIWVCGRVVAAGAVLAVYIDAAAVRTVAMRETFLVLSIAELAQTRDSRTPGIRVWPGAELEVLQVEGEAVRVRFDGSLFEATGYVRKQDTGKLYTWTGDGLDGSRCPGEDEPQRRLAPGARLLGRPGGPVLATVKKSDFDGENILVRILARRGRHVLVCGDSVDLLAWTSARHVRLRRRNDFDAVHNALVANPDDPAPEVVSSRHATLRPSTHLYDRPGGDVVGLVTKQLSLPIGDARPGDWVETRISTYLAPIPVWFQVPR
jgi:hypothetical protein